jgi:hypothetical protein
MSNLPKTDPTPADLFAASARVIKTFERTALQIGRAMDTIRGLVMLPLTLEQRRHVMGVLDACQGFEQVREAFTSTQNEIHNLCVDIERGSRG